jgi:hypothetical protein
VKYLILNGGELTKSRFNLRTFGSDTLLNYQLSQKLKLIGKDKFNYLINTLTDVLKESLYSKEYHLNGKKKTKFVTM